MQSPLGRIASPRPAATRGSGRRALGRQRSQGGFSLVEILIALVLAGVVVLGLAAGLLTLVRATANRMDRQQVELALASFGESLKAISYLDCAEAETPPATASGYQEAHDASALGWEPRPGMTAAVSKVEHWDRASSAFVAACGESDQGAQRLTLRVEWRDLTGMAQIVKRA